MGLAYDSARKRIVLFGGYNGRAIQDTWEYDGKNWAKINPTNQPSARCCAAFAYDATRKRTVIFGGFPGYLQETWEYDGKNWTQMKPKNSPSGRYDFDHMVYDQRRRRMVLFGGLRPFRQQLSDTWEYTMSPVLTGSPSTISIATGGRQTFALRAGTSNANRLYWIFGSVTGTAPGINLGGVHFPLNPDFYTDFTIGFPNTNILMNSRAKLDASGQGTASLNVPKGLPLPLNLTLHHAYLVFDAQGKWHMVSNPVPVTLVQ